MKPQDAIIVGGGLAGLTTAIGLLQHGLTPTVIESEKILGGRARSWPDPVTGDPVHIGPHIFLSIYPNMWKLLDVLGTRDKVVWQDSKSFITMVDGRDEIDMVSSPLPPPMHFIPSVFRDPTTSLADKVSNVPLSAFVLQMTEEDILALDKLSAYDFLRQMGVTEPYIRTFWSFTAMAIMNVPLEECSAAALMRFYRVLIGKKGYRIGFPDGGLGDIYAPQAHEWIEKHGGTILLDTRVTQFGPRGVRLSDGRTLESDTVVSTLPPQLLKRLIPDDWSTLAPFNTLEAFKPCPYVSVYLWFDRKLTHRQMWARTYHPDDLNCDFYDYSNIITGWRDRPSFICSNIIYSERIGKMSDEDVVAATLGEIAEYLPEAKAATLTHTVVNRIPMAIHCPRPGIETLRPPQNTPIDGFFLAGDWTDTGLPSSMESAVASGWLCAEHVLAARGRSVSLAETDWELGRFPRFAAKALGTVLSRRRALKALS